MHRKAVPKPLPTMDRKVPKSNKYSYISGVLNTGLTVDKVKSVTAREYAKRRDEIFFRITKTQLYELYNEYEADEFETIAETGRGAHNVHIVTYSEDERPVYEKPYLLLDMREIDEFQHCHLLQARSYPYAMLRRDSFHPDIYKFRNVPERLIIVYCNDERVSRLAAKDLVDRGIDNVFLLTGGMQEFSYEYPSFCEGAPPSPPKQKQLPKRLMRIVEDETYHETGQEIRHSSNHPNHSSPEGKLTARKLERHNQSYSTTREQFQHDNHSTSPRNFQQSLFPAASVLSTARSSRLAGVSGQHNPHRMAASGRMSDAGTQQSTMSVAESVISRATARKGKF